MMIFLSPLNNNIITCNEEFLVDDQVGINHFFLVDADSSTCNHKRVVDLRNK